MIRFLSLAAVLALCACARQEPAPAPSAPPAATNTAPTAPSSSTPAAGTQSEIEQATRSQESGDGDTEHTPSDTSLEQMAAAPAAAPLPPGKWQPGVNYTLLVPAQPTSVAAGNLVLNTAGGDVVEHAPVIYQQTAAGRQAVSGHYGPWQ